MSGYSEKDRRPIDPAPIVNLVVLSCDQDNIIDEYVVISSLLFLLLQLL
jgi:hypothetical protein